LPVPLDERLRQILLTAGLASRHPTSIEARVDPTDVTVVQAAGQRSAWANRSGGGATPFDPARSFHAAMVQDRLCLKGAPLNGHSGAELLRLPHKAAAEGDGARTADG
jgi:hypothetical protein